MTTPRKRFGQHFLRDKNIINKIVTALQIQSTDDCLEIGPGEGVLTTLVQPLCRHLTAIEIDRDLSARLRHVFANVDNFTLIESDVLKVNFAALAADLDKPSWRVFGNLPYNISTPLLFHLLAAKHLIRDMTFMLQKEVIDRMVATAGSKTYGRLSVMVQFHCQVTSLFNIGPNAFYPPPKVDSAIVTLVPYTQTPYPHCDPMRFADIVRLAFAHRRKTLANCLKGVISTEQFAAVGIDPQARAETLTVADFARLASFS